MLNVSFSNLAVNSGMFSFYEIELHKFIKPESVHSFLCYFCQRVNSVIGHHRPLTQNFKSKIGTIIKEVGVLLKSKSRKKVKA